MDNQNLFFLGIFIWVSLSGLAIVWMLQAQAEFLRLYRKKYKPKELQDSFYDISWAIYFPPKSWRIIRSFWNRQTDPEVEKARVKAQKRYLITAIITTVGTITTFVMLNYTLR